MSAQTRKDTLLANLKVQPPDTNRVLLLNKLFIEEYGNNLPLAIKYEQEALDLARELNFKKGISWATNNIGAGYLQLGNFKKAFEYHTRLYDMVVADKDSTGINAALNNLGAEHFNMGNFTRAVSYYEESLKLNIARKDRLAIQNALNNIGSCLQEQGKYPESLQYYFLALEMADESEENATAMTLGNIGNVFLYQNRDSIAMAYFTRALALYHKNGDKMGMITILGNFGEAYSWKKDYAQAEMYFNQGRVLCDSIGYLSKSVDFLWKEAEARLMQGNYDGVLDDYLTAEKIYEEGSSLSRLAYIKERIGRYYILRKDYRTALKYLNEGNKLAKSLQASDMELINLKGMSVCYEEIQDYANAFKAQKRYYSLNDSLYSEQKSLVIAELQHKYETQKGEKEISKLKLRYAQTELSLARSEQNSYILWGGITILVLLALFLGSMVRQKSKSNRVMALLNREIEAQKDLVEKQNAQIREINHQLEVKVEERTQDLRLANQELDVFLYESAHALRRPLTTTRGLIGLLENENNPDNRISLSEKVEFTLERMDRMLHKLIMVNENNRKVLDVHPLNFKNVIEAEVRAFADFPDINWQITIDPEASLQTDFFRFSGMLQNVLENSVAFRKPGGKTLISIEVKARKEGADLIIRDNGIGINAKVLDKMMEMFQRGTELSQGNGLGLFVARKFVLKLQGEMKILSEENQFTQVEVSLPNLS
ncbi:MAG: tetratricopeptide repeat protein [Bacteroidia bacterium]|nr:tetratricopeptide repeat protein [Bacteroidia bacterium]